MKKLLLIFAKVAISLGIMGFLIQRAWSNQVFGNLWNQPKNWWLLALATACCATAVVITIVRWRLLVRTAGLDLSMRESLRIGFLGYLFNLAPMGIVGGDLLKAVMLAWQRPGCRGKAIATVLVDRLIGLYILFVVASAAILLSGIWKISVPEIHLICQCTLWITVAGAVGIAVLFIPWVTEGPRAIAMTRLPRIGYLFQQSNEAIGIYRRKPQALAVAALMTFAVHGLFATGVYCIARGLFDRFHSLATHFVIMPLSSATGTIPLPMGPFEWVLNMLYAQMPPAAGPPIEDGQGFVVALGYRCVCLVIAAVGICYYLAARREVAQLMHEAQRQASHQEAEPTALLAAGE